MLEIYLEGDYDSVDNLAEMFIEGRIHLGLHYTDCDIIYEDSSVDCQYQFKKLVFYNNKNAENKIQ